MARVLTESEQMRGWMESSAHSKSLPDELLRELGRWYNTDDGAKLDAVVPDQYKKGGMVYRGMVFPKNAYERLLNGESVEFGEYASWTSNLDVAIEYALGANYDGRFGHTNIIKLVFTYNLPDSDTVVSYPAIMDDLGHESYLKQLTDFHGSDLEEEFGESEIVSRNPIKITKSNIFKIVD